MVVDGVEGEVGDGRRHVGGGERGEVVLHVLRCAPGPGSLTQPQPGGPRVAHECSSGIDRQRADRRDRLDDRLRQRDLGGDRVDHQREHLTLVGNVVVERHDLVAEFGGELAHRQRIGAVFVGVGDRPGDDRVAIECIRVRSGRTHA